MIVGIPDFVSTVKVLLVVMDSSLTLTVIVEVETTLSVGWSVRKYSLSTKLTVIDPSGKSELLDVSTCIDSSDGSDSESPMVN